MKWWMVRMAAEVVLVAVCIVLNYRTSRLLRKVHEINEDSIARYAKAQRILGDAQTTAATRTSTATVIHAPDGKCPDGWQLLPNAFLRADGSRCHACYLPGTVPVIDRLASGESISLSGYGAYGAYGAPR